MEEALAIADGSADEQRIVNTVLAFQRWRNLQLKKRFGQELKNVLKEAHQDEACFSAMEMELEKKDKLLSRAMADSAHLRAQLFALEEANAEPKVQFHHQQELKVAQKATIVEEEVQRRDNEIRRLQQQIRFLEDEAHRTNGTKHADISLLQRDKNSALIENKILLEQLARKDQEAIRLTKERENLQDKFSSLCESQITHESQIDILNEDNKAKMQSLQRKIEREQIAKKNIELHNHCSLKEAAVIVANANQSLRTQSENAADDAVTADNSTRYKKGTTQRHSSAKDVTFMDRALGALQVSLHQELQDVQALLLKYFSVLQQQVAGQKGDVVKALLEMKESNQERLLSLFWEVCNNLAAALVGAREQLTSIVGECQPHCRISQPVPKRQVSHALERKTHEKIYCTQPSYVNEDRFELCTTQDHRAEICHVDISGDSGLRAGSIKKSDTHFNVAFLKKHKDEGPQPSRRRKCFAAQYASLLQSKIGRLGGNKGNKTGDTQDTDYFKKVCVQKG